jgi:hypothetical protein
MVELASDATPAVARGEAAAATRKAPVAARAVATTAAQ